MYLHFRSDSGDFEPSTSSGCTKSGPTEPSQDSVPVVQFGEDLAHWEDPTKIKAPTIVKYVHCFV